MSISNYLEVKLLDAVFNNITYTAGANIWVSLHTADPTDVDATAAANEVSGGSYARADTAFDAAAAGATANTSLESFTNMPAVTITHVACWDSATAATNLLWSGALTASKVVNSGDTVEIAAGDLDVTLD